MKRWLAIMAAIVTLLILSAPVGAGGGLGKGRQMGRIITGGRWGTVPKKPHRIVIEPSGRPRRELLDPQEALRKIERARTPEALAGIISELVTYDDPYPGDLVGLALRKLQRLERPWWHPGRWLLDGEEAPPALHLAPLTVPAAGALLLRLMLISRGLPPG